MPPTSPHSAASISSSPQFVRVRVHALKAGTWPAEPEPVTLTTEDISAIAASYRPEVYQAPVVIGHPETDDPAWGWVVAASADGDGLWLDVDLLPEMAEWVASGRYRAVSVSLWTPNAPGNPAPGSYSLKHLGFLGAAAPAVKGLTPVRVHAEQDCRSTLTITFAEASMSSLAEREAALALREAELARREAALRREAFRSELERHVAAGQITASEVPMLLPVFEALHEARPIAFGEDAEQRTPLDLLREHLRRLPPRVPLGEVVSAQASLDNRPPKVPAGYRLSEAGLHVHNRAIAFMHAHPGTNYLDAVRAIQP